MIRSAITALALLGCSAAPQADAAPAAAPAAPAVTTPTSIVVQNNGNAGPGSLRAAIAACPAAITFAFTGFDLYVAEPLVVDCPGPIAITGPTLDAAVAGTEGRTVGTAALALPAIPRAGVTIINMGGADGMVVRSADVTINGLGFRGTTAAGFGDLAIRSASRVTLNGVSVGLDANGLNVPPATYRTRTSLLWVQDSDNVRVNGLAAGWNVDYWGAVVFQNVHSSHLYRSAVVGASWGKPPVDTKDAVSLVYGTSDFIIRETLITDNTSSSAVELHTADRVVVDDSSFARLGRAGVTVFDARDVTVQGVAISQVGTCGGVDDGGVVVYGGSARVAAVGNSITTNYCGGAYRPVFMVLPGASGEMR